MKHFARPFSFLLSLLLTLCAFLPLASAKTLEEALEGYETGEVWFGEDFAYDVYDEEACWELLMKPITVLDAGETEKIYPRVTPNGNKVVNDKLGGFINGASAAVHVLGEDEDGWTLIEGLDYYNRVIRGYVKTKLLKTVTPNEHYGIIVDKLTQRLYVYIDGHLWSSVKVSTGKPNDKQPYNESAAGEYLIMSWTGMLDSDGMKCDMALRYNGGDMIHQVPYTLNADGSKNFARFESYLGSKASHGCIRVQRVANEDGLNAQWLWDNLKKYTKVLIWDDKGRALPYPEETDVVYYNPNGGNYYHSDPNCSSVRSKYLPLSPITYADLETSAYSELTACSTCSPEKRISEIALFNYENGAITQEEYLSHLTRIPYPEDDLELYYNPNGGSYYHSTANCSNVKSRYLPLTAFTYGELDTGVFAKLKPCTHCKPVARKAEIDAENEAMGFPPLGEETAEEETDVEITIISD